MESMLDNYIGEVDAKIIIAEIKAGKSVHWNNVIIKGNLSIRDIILQDEGGRPVIGSKISITNCQIIGTVNFYGAIFKNKSQGYQGVNFADTQFCGTANFSETRFCQGANFVRSKFAGRADFRGAKFCSAVFTKAIFNGYADFHKARFSNIDNDAAILDGTTFLDYANFMDAHFYADAYFNWAYFNDYSNFNNAIFRGKAKFNNVTFKEALFENAEFLSKETLSFNGVKFEKLFTNWNNLYKPKYFVRCKNYGFFDVGTGDNYLIFNNSIYLSLIENFKKIGFFNDADECYYYYRIKSREKLTSIFKVLDSFFMLSYGYGTKPLRPLVWSLFFLFLFVILYIYLENIGLMRSVPISETLNTSLTLLLSGTKLIADPKYSATGLLYWIFNIEKIFGSLFFGLFILSISKAIMR